MEADFIIFDYQIIFVLAILCIFIVLFYLINQLVTFAAKRGLHYFLSYFFGSFLFLVLFMTYLMSTNQTERMTEFFPLLLQLIGLFGIIFVLSRSCYFIFKKLIKKALKVR